jgi:hypothetical protein
MVVSGKLRPAKVSKVQGVFVALTGAGASAPVAIMTMERTRRKKRRLIRHLLLLVGWVEDYCRRKSRVQYFFSMTAIGFPYVSPHQFVAAPDLSQTLPGLHPSLLMFRTRLRRKTSSRWMEKKCWERFAALS